MLKILRSGDLESEERRIEQLRREIEFLTIDVQVRKGQVKPKSRA
jgi:hypothetical protein